MRTATLASLALLSLAIAASPVTIAGIDMAALAKSGGNGGGNSGGNGGGGGHGGGGGNSGNHGSSSQGSGSTHGKSQGAKGKSTEAASKSKSDKAHEKKVSTKEKNLSAQLAGLNSLKRNYKALMHTSDPRMTAIAAYAMAYAQYELDNGIEPAADDPLLGDEALEDALASATKTGDVSPAVLSQAKTILGVGDANGKIDQIRTSLENAAPATSDE
ncbi:hypothetical protein [Rhizobium leguminosarum]|uniref:hypothetical protein n=1 Tax=Rhizobium leguminosarum TaxID=384 RepID=UPI0014418B20|nr:hypothetical protein [Rhizobium leguminosarum]NKK67732.1 hypothetical protein [Rhizobium leguminosarum bv. viciae]NKL09060.1 hypothetical protein [Rhizobium leguminosarum bv. viciae]NKL84837.1 hypothetical protein [Rhizobium leguminosarum bv. viciae]NKL94733.1 hypothetical protein [Rhizobium leguminosarum bv. viciae]NKM94984.1 hypothetical protein [Rhizobium leguminosarum bv. viciae]